jgi:FkbM family methyltransferase
MSPARLIQQTLRGLGLAVVRDHHAAVRYLDDPPQNVLDLVLLRTFPSLENLRFIQIGANDGLRADPIRNKVLRHHWSGLLMEPLPPLFAALQKNYAGCAGLEFINAAMDVVVGTRTIHFLRPGLSVPDWANGLPTFDLPRLQRTARDLGWSEADLMHQEIRTTTWDELLRQFGDRRCDLLVVDAEGYDLTILRSAPLARWRPKVIQFEHGCATPEDRLRFYGELLALGYEIASDGPDTVAWRGPDSLP